MAVRAPQFGLAFHRRAAERDKYYQVEDEE